MLDIDRDRQRISLGLKQTQEDPWQRVIDTYSVGDELEGAVTKVVAFGAFVEILEGVEGLVHISELAAHHVENPREVVSPGDERQGQDPRDRLRAPPPVAERQARRGPGAPDPLDRGRRRRPRRHARARPVRGRLRARRAEAEAARRARGRGPPSRGGGSPPSAEAERRGRGAAEPRSRRPESPSAEAEAAAEPEAEPRPSAEPDAERTPEVSRPSSASPAASARASPRRSRHWSASARRPCPRTRSSTSSTRTPSSSRLVRDRWGDEVVADGMVDRAAVARHAFASDEERDVARAAAVAAGGRAR